MLAFMANTQALLDLVIYRTARVRTSSSFNFLTEMKGETESTLNKNRLAQVDRAVVVMIHESQQHHIKEWGILDSV